jgi:hypothetical protein
MSRSLLAGVVAVVLGAADARAVEVTVGDGIAVVDLTKEDAAQVVRVADSAAAFAALAAPMLPPEYQAAVLIANGGWHLLRPAFQQPVPLRVVVTLLPPAVLVVPHAGMSPADVIRRYAELRAKVKGFVPEMLREHIQRSAAGLGSSVRTAFKPAR